MKFTRAAEAMRGTVNVFVIFSVMITLAWVVSGSNGIPKFAATGLTYDISVVVMLLVFAWMVIENGFYWIYVDYKNHAGFFRPRRRNKVAA
jgi:purine-cytosine permease-like protein